LVRFQVKFTEVLDRLNQNKNTKTLHTLYIYSVATQLGTWRLLRVPTILDDGRVITATLVMSFAAVLALVSMLSVLFGPHNLLSMCSFSGATVCDELAIAEDLVCINHLILEFRLPACIILRDNEAINHKANETSAAIDTFAQWLPNIKLGMSMRNAPRVFIV
jgi:hypothetical protein